MSGRRTGRGPQNDPELVRDIVQRQDDLDTSKTVRIGSWVLSEQGGELWATAPGRSEQLTGLSTPMEMPTVDRIRRRVTLIGAPSGGSWRLIYRGLTTSNLTYNESAGDILDALLALSAAFVPLDFAVEGPNAGPWVLTMPPGSLDADGSTLTGGSSPSVDIKPI